MNLDYLLKNFDLIAEMPGGVARLRELILELAVSGKLVKQEEGDEPVQKLIDAFQKAKCSEKNSGKNNQSYGEEIWNSAPFDIPAHWSWLRLCDIGNLSGGMTPSKEKAKYWNGDVCWFSSKDIKSDELFESELKITIQGVQETGLKMYPPGCLFMVARSGILKRTFPVAINRVEATVNQDLKVLRPFIAGLERYLQVVLQGMTKYILSSLVKTGMTVQSLKYEEFAVQPVPLPPLAEQKRIVAKVDELMALCDQLDAQMEDARKVAERVVLSIVGV